MLTLKRSGMENAVNVKSKLLNRMVLRPVLHSK